MAKAKDFPIREQLMERQSKLEDALIVSPDDSQVQRLLSEVDAAAVVVTSRSPSATLKSAARWL